MSKAPNDKKNLERDVKLRYSVQSGQSTIHGDTNYQVITQEAQSFGFIKAQDKVHLKGVGLEQVNMFYLRQACQWKFLVLD